MQFRLVSTVKFYKDVEIIGNNISLFLCSDGFEYIVKYSTKNGNFCHIINEFIAVNLANIVSVLVPDFVIVEINNDSFPSNFNFSLGLPSGLGLGFHYSPEDISIFADIDSFIDFSKNSKGNIIEDLIKISAFDLWLANFCRSLYKPSLAFQESGDLIRTYAINNSSIFSNRDYRNLDSEVNKFPNLGETLIDKELFQWIYFEYGLFFDQTKNSICRSIEEVEENNIWEILHSIPSVWNISSQEKELIFNFINERKSKVENHFDSLLKQIGI